MRMSKTDHTSINAYCLKLLAKYLRRNTFYFSSFSNVDIVKFFGRNHCALKYIFFYLSNYSSIYVLILYTENAGMKVWVYSYTHYRRTIALRRTYTMPAPYRRVTDFLKNLQSNTKFV